MPNITEDAAVRYNKKTFMNKSISARQLCAVAMFVSGLASTFYCWSYDKILEYDLLPLLPISFCIFAIPLIKSIHAKNSTWTTQIIAICLFLRYVVMPIFLCNDPCLSISLYSLSLESSNRAIIYMCYELIFLSVGLKIMCMTMPSAKTNGVYDINDLSASNGKYIYVAYVVFAFMVSVVVPSSHEGFSFIAIHAGTGVRQGGVSSTFANIMRQIVHIGMLMAFVLFVSWCSKRYKETRRTAYYALSLIAALLCTCVIVDERRSMQVYCAFASIVLLNRLFYSKRRQTVLVIIAVSASIVGLMTVYKGLYAFNYASYSEALAATGGFSHLGKTADLYLLGPTSVGAGLEPALAEKQSLGTLLYDIARHSIGISFLVKGFGVLSAGELYNLFVSGGINTSGVLLPISVEGSTSLWLPIGPILSLLLFRIAFKMENLIKSAESPVIVFFLSYTYIRFATSNVSAALSSVMLASTSVLVIVMTLVALQRLFPERKARYAVQQN